MPIPPIRIRTRNAAPVRADGAFVLYWMIATRRVHDNFALQRAIELGHELGRPVLIFEPLRCGYRWVSARHHRFVLDGMEDNRSACDRAGVAYLPWVERSEGEGRGLLEHLASQACCVVTDAWPCFFLPRMVDAAADRLPVRLEDVDSNGLLPLALPGRDFTAAVHFRRFAQKCWLDRTPTFPDEDPLSAAPDGAIDVPSTLGDRWQVAPRGLLDGTDGAAFTSLPIPAEPGVTLLRGGTVEARRRLERFVAERLARYGDDRDHPTADATSGLSPWLHFGHVSAHEIFRAVTAAEGWTRDALADSARGSRTGWWGMGDNAEAFIDQVLTWRELGYGFAWHRPDEVDRFDALPGWALETLADHAEDERPYLYDAGTLERAETHDELWNAAQRQLVEEGVMHNYLRMLWGKKVLHWSASPREAFDLLMELNNRYAVDGRDPNSYSGIAWVFGRFDRAWGPERPIFGKVRYMTSDSTRRKLRVNDYLKRYGPDRLL